MSRSSSLAILILVLAAFLRSYQLTILPPALTADEAMNGSNALENIETGSLSVFYPENFGREGLFINVQTAFVYLLGNEAWVLRLPAVVFGTLTVLGIYLLGMELFSETVGLWAAFLLATSFWHIVFSRIGLRAITAPFFLVWGLYFLLRAIRSVHQKRPYLWLVGGIVYALGFYSYIAYRTTPLLILMILVLTYGSSRGRHLGWWRGWMWFAGAAGMVAAPLAAYFWRHPDAFLGRTSQISIFRNPHPFLELGSNIWKTFLMLGVSGDPVWEHNYSGRPALFWPVAACLAAGIFLALLALWKRESLAGAYVISLGAIALGALPVVLSSGGIPHALRSLMMIPGIFLLAGVGADHLHQRLASAIPKTARVPLAAVVLAGLCFEAYHTYFERWGRYPSLPRHFASRTVEYAQQINALPVTLPKYVVVTTGDQMAHGIPVSAQPIMFLTNTYTRRGQEARNVHYVTPTTAGIPSDGMTDAAFCRQFARTLQEGAVYCLTR